MEKLLNKKSHYAPLTTQNPPHITHHPEGISLITLIITIIVIIILAAIVIFTGLNTPEKAGLAKYVQESSGFQEAVTNRYLNQKTKLTIDGQQRTEAQIYYWIATGSDTTTTPTASETLTGLGLSFYPETIKGENCYEITQEQVEGIKVNDTFSKAGDHTYITDKGEVFTLPGYLVQENGTDKWYVNSSKYYTGEAVNGPAPIDLTQYEVGQAIDYHPSDNTGYASDTEVAPGVTAKAGTVIDTDRTIWRIFDIDEEHGVIKITPGVVNAGQITLRGVEAYYDPATGLNAICNQLYKNTTLNLPVTNMTYQELNDACNYYPSKTYGDTAASNVVFYEKDTDLASTSGETILGKDGYSIVAEDANTITVKEGTGESAPTVVYTKRKHDNTTYTFYTGNGEVMYGGGPADSVNGHNCIKPYQDGDGKYHPVFVRSTYATYDPSSKVSELGNVLGTGSNYGWLVSPCVGVYSRYASADFAVCFARGSGVDAGIVASSNGTSDSTSRGLLPVVSLPASLLTGEGSVANSAADPGDDTNPWGIR